MKLCVLLLLRIHLIGRLDIDTTVIIIYNEVDFTLDAFISLAFRYHTDINGITFFISSL